jgi:hypothetical protein
MFTHIVDAIERAATMGEQRWSELLRRFYEVLVIIRAHARRLSDFAILLQIKATMPDRRVYSRPKQGELHARRENGSKIPKQVMAAEVAEAKPPEPLSVTVSLLLPSGEETLSEIADEVKKTGKPRMVTVRSLAIRLGEVRS